ncbi:MAG: hypothetical protein DSZ09_04280 [Sulfurovum sp.]|nr:MAG: hypothetical protein DSZ09_04280 [Sulfurovum sp.]
MKIVIVIMMLTLTSLMGGSKVLYTLDFSKQKDGDALPWLKSKGFEFFLSSKALHLRFNQGLLTFGTTGEKAGLFGVRFSKALPNIGSVVIEWGVKQFPKGANWSKGNNRVALAAMFAMGTKKYSSGVPFAKKMPYFLSAFIGKKETVGKAYKGKLYKKTGRYYCVSNKKGLIKTRFNIAKKFTQAFDKKEPPLTAFGFQMNTKDTKGGATAVIKKITFYSK